MNEPECLQRLPFERDRGLAAARTQTDLTQSAVLRPDAMERA